MAKPPAEDDGLVDHPDCDFPIFKKGRDIGGSHTNYEFTQQEQETLASYDSVDYLPSDSEVFRAWAMQQTHRLNLFRWIIMGFIGLTVGIVGFFLRSLIELLSDVRIDRPRELLQATPANYLAAWGWATGFAVIFLVIASALVVLVSPSAASSGVPELTAFLNGTLVRHYFNLRTFVVKFTSCILAVSSGLPVGQEGPMIHIGSIIGSWLSQFKSDTLKFRVPFFQKFRNSQDRRNFISAGAAAGIATAFNAPIGGLLFSMEEVSSFWNEMLSWQIFFCCTVAVITNVLLSKALPHLNRSGLGDLRFQQYILFQVKHQFDYSLTIFIPVVVLGLLGGVLGAGFIFLNLKIHRARKRLLSAVPIKWLQRMLRFAEPVLIGAVYATVAIFLPAAFTCKRISCSVPLNLRGDNRLYSHCAVRPGGTENDLLIDRDFDNYTCPKGSILIETISMGNRSYQTAIFTNATYSPVATLMFVTGEKMIRHLFSRETYDEFEYDVLLAVLAVYFIGSCYSAGMSISVGLVIPQLVIGALYGRIVGQVMVRIFGQPGNGGGLLWMDPGAMSLIGAASFFGGVTRLTTSIVVLMMELTNDMQFLLPVMVAVMVAKAVGELITHSIYRSQMNLKCIPHLISEPVVHDYNNKRVSLELFCAGDVMSNPVETVFERERLQRIVHLLLNSTHGGFPVVRHIDDGADVFNGLITRMELLALMVKKAFLPEVAVQGHTGQLTQMDYDQLNIDRLSNPQLVEQTLQQYAHNVTYKDTTLNLRPYVNQSAMAVRKNFSLQRTYNLMRSMGIRHVTVVDERNRVSGIITRKDLMGFNLETRLKSVTTHGRRPSDPFSVFLPAR